MFCSLVQCVHCDDDDSEDDDGGSDDVTVIIVMCTNINLCCSR